MKFPALLAAAALAAACSVIPEPVSKPAAAPTQPRTPTTADELFAYIARLRVLDDVALALETNRQREFVRQSRSEVARLKLALTLAASPQSEEGDLIALVEPLARSGGTDPDVITMASFLHGMALERRRLKESAAAAGIKSKEDRRAWEQQKQRADTLQERNAQLQQKLDALTDLEKSLSTRKGN